MEYLFNAFDLLIRFIIFIPVFFTFIDALPITRDLIKSYIKYRNSVRRWSQGKIDTEDLFSLTPMEFDYWCGEFISKFGYNNMNHQKPSLKEVKNIVCMQGTSIVYICCRRYIYKAGSTEKIDAEICKSLVGAMVHDGVRNGLIITSGIITKDAVNYIRTLPKDYEIQLLDGKDIITQYSYAHQNKPQTA